MSTKSKILILAAFVFCLPMTADAGTIIRPVMNSGLIGYWNFQEGAGSSAYDKSGNLNHGTLTNMDPATDWTDGRLGGGLDFDGSDDYAGDADGENYLNGLNKITISVWVKSDVTGTDNGVISGDTADNDNGISVRYDNSGLFGGGNNLIKVGFGDASTNNADFSAHLESSENVQTTEWQHIVTTWEVGSAPRLYLNGQLDNPTYTSVYDSSISNLDFLRIGDHGDGNWDGKIDEVRIYNRALSGEEIERLYNLTRPKIKAPTRDGLVGYWSMDEGAGTRVGDMSGNGNHGAMQNMDPATDWVTGKYGKALDFDGVMIM